MFKQSEKYFLELGVWGSVPGGGFRKVIARSVAERPAQSHSTCNYDLHSSLRDLKLLKLLMVFIVECTTVDSSS
eukprot:5128007-Amphidinium_carterae.1